MAGFCGVKYMYHHCHDCNVVILVLHAGLITDPMAMYRESKVTNIWTDEEKRVFKEK